MEKDPERYLIMFDVDGTLARPDQTIGERTRSIIGELIERGHYVSIASGRPIRAIAPLYDSLGMNGPAVCHAGAEVINPSDPTFPKTIRMIPRDVILRFLSLSGCADRVNIQAESEDTLYLTVHDPSLKGFYHLSGIRQVRGEMADILDSDSFLFAVMIPDRSMDQAFVEAGKKLDGYRVHMFDGPDYRICELTRNDVTKASGIDIATRSLGLDDDHVIVVGDGDNDLEMLAAFPNSIAMANATEEAKRAAHYQARFTNADDGAAIGVLERLNALTGR